MQKTNDTAAQNDNLLLTVSPPPHIKGVVTTRLIMLDVLVALTPALIWSIYIFGWRSLTVTLICVGCCVLFELWYQLLMRKPVTVGDLSAAVTGMLLAFCLPASVSLWIPVAGAFFAIVLVKQLFGGVGKNIVNPALAARIFIFISWTNEVAFVPMPFAKLPPFALSAADTLTSATPLAALKMGELPDVSVFDLAIGNCPGAAGEVSALLLIAGGIYLLVRGVITWHIPVSFIATAAAISLLFPMHTLARQFMLYQLLSGGLLLAAIFMATDYSTSPATRSGRLIYGVGCGLITMFIRYFGGYADGVSFAILIMNLLVWYIDRFTKPQRFGGASKTVK